MTEIPLRESDLFPRFKVEITDTDGPTLTQSILENGGTINPPGIKILETMQKPDKTEMIEVVKFRLNDIGFRVRANHWAFGPNAWKLIKDGLESHGLSLCPQLTAPILAKSKTGIFREKKVLVLSEPIINSDGSSLLFYLDGSGKTASLDAYRIGAFWDDEVAIASVNP